MTIEIPATPATAASADDAVFEVMRADAVLTGRAMSSGQYLAGLIVDAQLETVARPDKLPADLFPGVDPVVVQAVWDRALAVGFHAGRVYASSPRFAAEELARVQEQFAAAGFEAMARTAGRSRGLVERAAAHPGDGEISREHH
jgi:hypothetical protein